MIKSFLFVAFALSVFGSDRGTGPMHTSKEYREKYEKFVSGLNAGAKKAFFDLLDARDRFEEAEGEYYDVLGGEREANNFSANLERLMEKGPPPCSSAEFQEADKELNVVYKAIPAARAKLEYPGQKSYYDLHPQEKRRYAREEDMVPEFKRILTKVERRWITYRDAWASFGTAYSPKSNSICWKLGITRERISQLRNVDMVLH